MSWLQRVQLIFKQGNHTYRDLGRRAGISHTHVANIISGRTIPSLEMLFMLLNALTTNQTSIQTILQLFANENPGYQLHTTQTEHRPGPTQADIKALTAAVTELSGLLREWLQEHRRNPQ